MFLIPALILVIFLLYKWVHSSSCYFEKRGIPYVPARLLKTTIAMATNQKPLTEWIQEWASELENEK